MSRVTLTLLDYMLSGLKHGAAGAALWFDILPGS